MRKNDIASVVRSQDNIQVIYWFSQNYLSSIISAVQKNALTWFYSFSYAFNEIIQSL